MQLVRIDSINVGAVKYLYTQRYETVGGPFSD